MTSLAYSNNSPYARLVLLFNDIVQQCYHGASLMYNKSVNTTSVTTTV